MIPPFGYFKDKNTKQVVIVEEAAETVRMIFTAYIGGHGLKAIAKMLNEQKRKTPALTQLGLLNKHTPNTQGGIIKKYLWDGRMVGRILQDESYIGKLKRDISMMDDILNEGHLSEAHLRLLVDKIYVHEEDGKLSLDICLKAPFWDHLDIYENGEQTECWVPHNYGFELLDDIIPNNLHEDE